MLRLSFFLWLVLLVAGCRDDEGEQLFTTVYPPLDFQLTAGIPPFQAFVVRLEEVNSQWTESLDGANVSPDQVDEVGGFFARITSLSGEDFGQLREVELRICPLDQGNCDQFDILFSLDDLYLRRNLVLNLNPGLRNFRELVSSGRFNFELVFFYGETASQSIDCRLEWAIRGVAR